MKIWFWWKTKSSLTNCQASWTWTCPTRRRFSQWSSEQLCKTETTTVSWKCSERSISQHLLCLKVWSSWRKMSRRSLSRQVLCVLQEGTRLSTQMWSAFARGGTPSSTIKLLKTRLQTSPPSTCQLICKPKFQRTGLCSCTQHGCHLVSITSCCTVQSPRGLSSKKS